MRPARLPNMLRMAPSFVQRHRERKNLAQAASREGVVVLSFDDGPSARMTGEVLSLLAEAKTHATFFMVGSQALRNPDVAEGVRSAGHEIGSHSLRHRHALDVGPAVATVDYTNGQEALQSLGIEAALFRPPYGKVAMRTRHRCLRDGVQLGWWTIDSGDSWRDLPDAERVVARVERDNGGVVLMHDLDRQGASGSAREAYTLELTRRLLAVARERSLNLITLGQLLDRVSPKGPS